MRIGLTGGIGSGKSTVAAMLVARGAVLIDTDAIAREIAQPGGAAMPAIEAAFGPDLLTPDGGLDRERMRALAFSDPTARTRLEAILHPMIGRVCEERARSDEAIRAPMQVFDVPLLVESGRWRAQVDRVLVIDADEATQVRRVMARSGWTEEAVMRVIRLQATRAQRRAVADAVVLNDGLGLEELSAQVGALWSRWTGTR